MHAGLSIQVHFALQAQSGAFKCLLLQFSYEPEVQASIVRCRETTREHDVAAINLEVTSLNNKHVQDLIDRSEELRKQVSLTDQLAGHLKDVVISSHVPPELAQCNQNLAEELEELHTKNAKIADHVGYLSFAIEKSPTCKTNKSHSLQCWSCIDVFRLPEIGWPL